MQNEESRKKNIKSFCLFARGTNQNFELKTMKLKTIYVCISVCFCQLLVSQTYELQNSISFNKLNDGRDIADGITWFQPEPLDYGIYRTAGSWSAPSYQQLKIAFETGIIIDGGYRYGKSGTFLQPDGGKVGIGTYSPEALLHNSGDFQNNGNILLGHMGEINYVTSREVGQILGIRGSQDIRFGTYASGWSERMIISNSGNVGIGTANPNNKLDVNGTIHSKEVKVDMTGWSDYVFKKDYNLPTLEQVEKHIAEKGHLENIPNEVEVLKNGINLGEMNSKLLQKIEEITLYIIRQEKKNSLQTLEIENSKNEIEVLKKQNESFKNILYRLSKIEEKLK